MLKIRKNIALIDWGTSSLRVYSFTAGDTSPILLLEDATAGVLSIPIGGFEIALEEALSRSSEKALSQSGEKIFSTDSPVLLCGMVGSNRGWREVRYVHAPASLMNDIAKGCVTFNSSLTGRSITIIPGVCTLTNFNGQPDVMRGEETQVLGELFWTQTAAASTTRNDEMRVFCLPGTHSKWVICRGNKIESMQTSMTGEIFSVLSRHSILSGSIASEDKSSAAVIDNVEEKAFEAGLMTNAPLHALFSVRTRDLFSGGGEARKRACIANRGWLSGALLALELREASKWLSTSIFPTPSQVSIIGTGPLAERYARAMTLMGIAQPTVSAPHAAAKGLIIIGEILGILPSRNPSSIITSSLPPTSLTNYNELIHQQRLNLLTNSLRLVPIIAILRGLDPTNAVDVGISLYEAGIRIIEVPLNSPIRPLESIRSLIAAFEHLPEEERPIVGAGTVLSVEDVKNVASIGGQVALAPNTDTDVIRAARAAGLPFFPGIATASEALLAVKAGASGLKLFPCTSISVSTVEALKAILPNKIPLLAVGGVGASNGLSYLSAGCIGLGIGSAIFDPTVSPIEVQTNAIKLVKALGRNAN